LDVGIRRVQQKNKTKHEKWAENKGNVSTSALAEKLHGIQMFMLGFFS